MKSIVLVLLSIFLLVTAAGYFLYTPDLDRAALEAKYGASPADFVQVAGVRLRVRDTGPRNAPVVILLHGLGSSLETWDGWAPVLATRFRVMQFDLPGFGLTGADPGGDYSDARTVQVLGALMDFYGVRRASLIGNSLGGKIAWNFAAAFPQRVEKLVLVSPDGFASPGFEYGKTAKVPLLFRLLPYVLPTSLLRMSLAPAFGNPTALSDNLVGRYRDMMLAPGVRRAMIARMAQVRLEQPEPLLRRIMAPTLLVWGERDAMIPFGNARDYLADIAGSRLVSFADLGHVPQEEAPERSVAPVLAFLASFSPAAAHH